MYHRGWAASFVCWKRGLRGGLQERLLEARLVDGEARRWLVRVTHWRLLHGIAHLLRIAHWWLVRVALRRLLGISHWRLSRIASRRVLRITLRRLLGIPHLRLNGLLVWIVVHL